MSDTDFSEPAHVGPSDAPPRTWNGPRPSAWRSLAELERSPEVAAYLAREFPSQTADHWDDPASRRQFLKLMGASLALAGVSGCAFTPSEQIVPFVKQPEELLPGEPLNYATAVTLGGYATGVLVKTHQGRPIKIEGNELHPASLGSSDVFAQAAVLDLYDPDRSQVVLHNGRVSTWGGFLAGLTGALEQQRGKEGAGLRALTGDVTSPTLARLLNQVLETYPKAKWCSYEPVSRENARQGLKLACGTALEPVYHLDKADVIVALDAELFGRGPQRIRLARDFAARRGPDGTMNRLYVAEPTPTTTGAIADHRLPTQSRRIVSVLAAVGRSLKVEGVPTTNEAPDAAAASWVSAVVKDLEGHRGSSVVIVGDDQPPELHALAAAINGALGNVGKTVAYIEPVVARPARPEQALGLDELVKEIETGAVEALLVLGPNPGYSAPVDLGFAAALSTTRQDGSGRARDAVPFSVHLGHHDDETAQLCEWHVPMAHALESWGDARGFDGTATIQQPLIAPLYGGKSAIEVVAAMLGQMDKPALEIVRDTWRIAHGDEATFEAYWKQSVHDGVIAGTAFTPKEVAPRAPGRLPEVNEEGLEIVFAPDPTIYDGRFANNGWLQELPKPLTKLTWDNVALLSPATAAALGVTTANALNLDEKAAALVRLEYQGRTLEAAAWVQPGQVEGSITLSLGYGRRRAGRAGTGAGFNANLLRTWGAPGFGPGLSARTTGRTYALANTQHQQMIDSRISDRELVLMAPIGEFREHPDHFAHAVHTPETAFRLDEPPGPLKKRQEEGFGNAWAMAINLNACIGCGACTIACQAENNIPVVGKKQVIAGRAMHWIRVDHYFKGGAENPKHLHQPVPCMHCENAPCELVCPVAATSHSAEGLNEMTYNRCVGTRYCGNNCPYKVRRFNYLQFTDLETPSLKLLNNPDVTVRTRGVMEKCTFCVQRINHARMTVEKAGRDQVLEKDGLQTACQQACPTRAIIFGNYNDPSSAIARARGDKRNYALLAELNTRPRTTYLARLTNPNTELESE